jgi:N-acetylmuramoyl-L-alanine amidase
MQNKNKKKTGVFAAIALTLALVLTGCAFGPESSKDLTAQSAGDAAVQDSSSQAVRSDSSGTESTSAQESVSSVSGSSQSDSNVLVPEPVTASSDESGNTVYKTNTEVRVRTAPSTDSAVYTSLPEGTEVEVEGEEDGWYQIRLDGDIYYIRKDLVTKTGGSSGTATASGTGMTVVVDPGHQAQADQSQEPVGPGSSEMKAKVTGGATGKTTGLKEYDLNLKIGLKLQSILTERGYNVVMTRTTNDVNISNSERAEIANDANAAAFIRVHANGSENSGVSGAMTICQTSSNPYNGEFYQQSRALSDDVLNGLVASAQCRKQSVWETDTMSGINWCKVPATIVEVGYLSNAEEEQKLATDDYQQKLAEGIADGVDQFLAA